MSGLLLLLLAPLVSSVPYSYYRSYRPASSIHSPRYNQRYLPTFSGRSSYSSKIRYPSSDNQRYLPTFSGTSSYSSKLRYSSSDIVQQTRTQADSLKNTLRTLVNIPGANRIVNRVINDVDNVCLNSIEEAIDAVETSAGIVETAGPDIKKLIKTVEAFQTITDAPTAVRESANILRLLEVLIPKLAPANPEVCKASNAQAFGSLRSLAALVNELASSTDFYMTPQTRTELKTSSKIISGVTNFLVKLNKSFTKFDKFCTSDKEYNIEAITAIGEMMTDLADLFSVLGGISDAEEIRKQGDFTKRVVANINKIGNLDLGTLECNKPGSFKVAAETLDDIAKLIEEVGIKALCNQLDMDLDCDFF